MCQNIMKARASVTRATITEYLKCLSAELEVIFASHIGSCDDPVGKRITTRADINIPNGL